MRTKPFLVSLALCGLTTLGLAAAQGDSPSPIQQARSLVFARDFAAALPVLEQLVQNEPENGGAWLLLGQARVGLGEYDAAGPALDKAQSFAPLRARALREKLLAKAGKGDREGAAKLLDEALVAGVGDLSGLHLRPELASLAGDPRFGVLFPSGFDDPFVERQAVVHDWRGEGPGHEFGWEARAAGDVDGDGAIDAVCTAPGNQPGADASGLVYLYSGKSGELLWIDKGEPGDQLGLGVESAGDVDADGRPDVIAGAPGVDRAIVYSGATGLRLFTLSGSEDDAQSFGGNVSSAGDVDGDGHADLLVGAAAAAAGAGRVYVFSGRTGARLASWEGAGAGDALGATVAGAGRGAALLLVVGAPGAGEGARGQVLVYRDLSGKPAFVIEADETGAALGQMFVSVVGDVDADGVQDVYASDWANGAKGPFTGRVYVHSGVDGRRLLTLTGEAPGDGFGIGPARAGDVNGDGHADLVVGGWQHRSAALSGGKIYVYSGKDGELLESFTGKIPGETLGFDADGLGDVDGDGRYDYLVTSAWSLIRGVRSGRALVVSGSVARSGG